MPIEPSDEAKRLLSAEELKIVRKGYADFKAQAAESRDPNGMRKDKTDFPIGIYDDEVEPNYDNPLR